MGGVHFFVPTVSRPNSVSPLTVASRPTSPAAGALSLPTRLSHVVPAGVHRPMIPMGGAVYNFMGESTTGAIGRRPAGFDRRLPGRHSERTLRRLLPSNPDGQRTVYVKWGASGK